MISRKVLLINDGAIFPGLERKLRKRGYDVSQVLAAEDVKEVAGRITPDVVISSPPWDEANHACAGIRGHGDGVFIRTVEPVPGGGCCQWFQGRDDRHLLATLDYIFEMIGLRREKRAVEKELAEAQKRLAYMKERCRCDAALLSEGENHWHTVLDANPDPIVLYDTERKVRYVNSAFTDVFGWQPEDLIGEGTASFVPPEKAGEEAEMALKEKEGQSYASIETWRYACSGKMIPVSISGAAYRDRGGTVLGSVCNIRDISRQKELELQLVQSQKMEAIGTLAGGIVHDFNNILSAVFGYLDLALMELPEGNPATENLNRVMEAAHRAKELVRQILSFSRRQDQGWQPVNLKSVLGEAMALIRASIPSTIEIRYKCGERDMWALADSTQIHQVVMNLCTNAHHAMKSTGGLLAVKLSSVELKSNNTCWDLTPGRYIRISVSDTGCGIGRDEVKRIFDPYYTTKPKNMGTGLGLAVVQRIIKDHNGMVRVSSEPGKGTRFELLLPEDRGRTASASETKILMDTGSERILFVDDEESLATLGEQMLSRLGYSVTAETDPLKALERFRASPMDFDMIITDLTMPGMTGDQLAETVMGIRDNIPVVMLTGQGEKEIMGKTTCPGLRSLMLKPLAMSELSRVVREIFDANGAGGCRN